MAAKFFDRLFSGSDEPEEEAEPVVEAPTTLSPPADDSLDGYLRAARQIGASDLHLGGGGIPYARVEGQLLRFDVPPLPADRMEDIARELRQLGRVEASRDLDFTIQVSGLGRFRVNLHRQRRGPAAAFKVISDQIPTLEDLGLPESMYDMTEHRQGLVLVTGPSGCGKSSTLAALVSHIDRTRAQHVVTIEDPIEFVFPSTRCNITQREVGPHTRSFEGALRAALREDPDVILVAELRDIETIRTAIVAAETGHLVLGTLHTRDAVSTINRLLDLFPARERSQIRTMLAATLRTVVSQRLLPRAGGGRRVPAYEVLKVTPAASTHIREGRTHQLLSLLQTGRRHGMIDLDARLRQLLNFREITEEVALENAKDPRRFGGGSGA